MNILRTARHLLATLALASVLVGTVGCKKDGGSATKTPEGAAGADEKPAKKLAEGVGAELGKAEAPAAEGKAEQAAAAEPAPSGDGWVDFTSPEGAFKARFPSAPEKQTIPTPTDIGNVDQNMFSVTSAVAFFAASYADYPAAAVKGSDPNAVLDGARDGAVGNVQGKLISEDKITLNGHPGRALRIEATPQGQSIQVQARVFLAKNRLYQMIVVRPAGMGSDDDANKFLESLTLTGEGSAQGH